MIYGWLRFIIGLTFEVYCCKWYRCGIKLLDTSEKKTSSILLKHSKFFFYTAKYFRFSLLCSAYFFYSLSNLIQCFLVTDYFPVQYPIVKYGIVLLFLLCVDCPLTRENTVQTTYKCIAGTVMNEKHTFFSRRITLIFHIQLTQLILLFFGPCLLIPVRNSHIYKLYISGEWGKRDKNRIKSKWVSNNGQKTKFNFVSVWCKADATNL